MGKLPRGWTRLKVIGEAEPIQVLVHRDTGKFGAIADESETIKQFDSLAQVEAWAREIHESGAIDAVIIESPYHDRAMMTIRRVKVRQVGKAWAYLDGSLVPTYTNLRRPNDAVMVEIEQRRQDFEQARVAMERAKDEAWELSRTMEEL